jgi:hypothetical protein
MTLKSKPARPWPTLEGRLRQPLTSRAEAVRQLQGMVPITLVAEAVLSSHSSTVSFPIQGFWSRKQWKNVPATTIPWAMIAPHEPQALWNHCGQSLERLAQRGGLAPCEAIAVLEDRKWHMMNEDESAAKLAEMATAYSSNK